MKTFIILFLLGFFISCASNRTADIKQDEPVFFPECPGSFK